MLAYFTPYVALGDSVFIDLYPEDNAGATALAVAREDDPGAGSVAPVGQAWRAALEAANAVDADA